MSEPPSTRYRCIIQIDRPSQDLDMPAVLEMLQGTGVELDASYGPLLINPKLGRYVVRGSTTPDARGKAEQIPGVRFFAEAGVEPI